MLERENKYEEQNKSFIDGKLVCAVFGGCSSSKKTEKWLLTKRSSYGEGGELERWGEATYDENGNEVEWKSYDNEGTITYRRECTYDENGNQVIKEYGEQDQAGFGENL